MIEQVPQDVAINFISVVGFPIAMCLILVYERFLDRKSNTGIIENNTKAITKLTTLVEERLKQWG